MEYILKKTTKIIALGMAVLLILSGCGVSHESGGDTETPKEENEAEENEVGENEAGENEVADNAEDDLTFSDLYGQEFTFASGAGAWCTILYINADGTFQGNYHDADMGDSSEAYPNGVLYYCEFSGKLGEMEKVDEYTYKTSIQSMEYEDEEGTSEIIDGTLYRYSGAYGLDDAKDIYIYRPGKKVSELDEGYLSWASMALVKDYHTDERYEELPFYGLYNEAAEEGFCSYDSLENVKEIMEEAEAKDAELREELNQAQTQMELNTLEYQRYEVWDNVLNDMWTSFKYMQNPEDREKLVAEQRQWILDKEEESQKAGQEAEGGSMQNLLIASKAAEMTEQRVRELYQFFSEKQK